MNEQRIGGDIRTPRPHDSAHKHVSGAAVYVDDITTPEDTLVVLIGQSPHAHAAITAMDLSAVAAAEGVVAVLTHADIPGVNDCSPVYGDDPILADGEVSYVGQAVFAIVAPTMPCGPPKPRKAVFDWVCVLHRCEITRICGM